MIFVIDASLLKVRLVWQGWFTALSYWDIPNMNKAFMKSHLAHGEGWQMVASNDALMIYSPMACCVLFTFGQGFAYKTKGQ